MKPATNSNKQQVKLTAFFKPKTPTTTTTTTTSQDAAAAAAPTVVSTNNTTTTEQAKVEQDKAVSNNTTTTTTVLLDDEVEEEVKEVTVTKQSGSIRPRENIENNNNDTTENNNNQSMMMMMNTNNNIPAPPQQEASKKPIVDNQKNNNNTAETGSSEDDVSLDELIKSLSVPNATSMAQLFQDSDAGATFFIKELKHSFTTWPKDTPCTYNYWADVLADVSATSSRNLVLRRLTFGMLILLIRGTQQDLIHALYLCINEVAAAHEGVELGIGDATLMSVVSDMCGMTMQRLRQEYASTGDLAEIAQNHKKRQATLCAPKRLTLGGVFKGFKTIACTTGKDTQRKRADQIKVLLRDAVGCEVNFIVRALQGKMRIGVALSSLISALGFSLALYRVIDSSDTVNLATTTMDQLTGGSDANNNNNNNNAAQQGGGIKKAPWHSKNFEPVQLQALLAHYAESVSQAYHQCPAIEEVIPTIYRVGKAASPALWLPKLQIRVGVPVKPMLAHPTTSIRQLLERFSASGAFTCEFKYDGERCQTHFNKHCAAQPFSLYSRNSESYTTKFPDVIKGMPQAFDKNDSEGRTEVTSFIMDGEVVAVDTETGKLRPFQVLQHRGKKNVQIENISCAVRYFAFDLLMLNGESLLHLPLRRRREILRTTFVECPTLGYAKNLDSSDVEDIQAFLETSVTEGCEGLMVKTLDENAQYTPFKRSYHWLKLKKDYMEGVGDTLDLIPVGAYLGKGKRTGVYGGFLLACYNQDTDEFQSICKIGTGFKDEDLERLANLLRPTVQAAAPVHVPEVLKPDVWFTPMYVWEVRAADLSISPVHSAAAGIVDPSKGIALRFPRFIKQRDDKQPHDATSSEQVAQMYRAQALVSADGDVKDEDEW